MPSKRLFDRRYGKGALARLQSMLHDPALAYECIASKFGLTRQYIAQIANELDIDGQRRRRERALKREPRRLTPVYPPDVLAVIDKIKRAGIQVTPYYAPQRALLNYVRRSKKMVFLNGVLCTIQIRTEYKPSPNGRLYVRFHVGRDMRRAKAGVFVIRRSDTMKIYIVPMRRLRGISAVFIPSDGKYVIPGSKHRWKKWNHYENAWHLLDDRSPQGMKGHT
jgi:hypothetical protein